MWKTNCPFANLPEKKRTQWALTKEEMKNCVWLKPELVKMAWEHGADFQVRFNKSTAQAQEMKEGALRVL